MSMKDHPKDWENAPASATHKHKQSHAWYNVTDDVVRVLGHNSKWNASKVKADSPMLEPRPIKTKETEPMPQIIEADSLEDLERQMRAAGIPNQVIADILSQLPEEDAEGQEEACNCPNCRTMSREEKGHIVGIKLAKLLKAIKKELELDFDLEEVMNLIGFAKQPEEKSEAEVFAEAMEPVIKQIIDETGMPAQVAIAGTLQVYNALKAHDMIK